MNETYDLIRKSQFGDELAREKLLDELLTEMKQAGIIG